MNKSEVKSLSVFLREHIEQVYGGESFDSLINTWLASNKLLRDRRAEINVTCIMDFMLDAGNFDFEIVDGGGARGSDLSVNKMNFFKSRGVDQGIVIRKMLERILKDEAE